MKAVIVLPTYNERKNMELLVPRLQKEFKKIKSHEMHILVVDDNSPDKTADLVRKFQKKYKNLHLITGQKQGLGIAYLRGFEYSMSELNADVVFEMDADLSHPPEMVHKFMQEIDNGHDLVIGSRYIKGGDTPDWNLRRRLISRTGNLFARLIGGMYQVHDCTSGFRAIRTSILKMINTKDLYTRGYAFQSTFLFEFTYAGAKIKEIPLVFYDRKHGTSKLTTKDLIEFFFNSFRLRFRSTSRFARFIVVGSSGILVNLGFFLIAKGSIPSGYFDSTSALIAASLIGDEISILYNFILNKFWTFRAKEKSKVLKQFFSFHIIAVVSILINNIVLVILHNYFGIMDVAAKLIGILTAFLWNYFFNMNYVSREE